MSWEEKLDFGEMYKALMEMLREYDYQSEGIGVPKPIKDLLVFLKKKDLEKPRHRIKTKYTRRLVLKELNEE